MESIFLVMLNQIFKVIWEYDNLHAAEVGSAEFLGTNTSETNFLPYFRYVCFLGSFKCCLILLQLYKDLGQLVVVTNMTVKDLRGFIQFVIVTSISALLDVSLVWLGDKGFKLGEVALAAICIGKDELGIDHLLFKHGSGHQQVLN